MVFTVLKSTFPKEKPKEIIYRNFKNFDLNNFKNDIRTNMQLVDNYDGFEKEFLKVLNNHAPLKKKFIRANHVPYMTKALCKAIMKRSQLESKYYGINIKNRRIFVANYTKRKGRSYIQI